MADLYDAASEREQHNNELALVAHKERAKSVKRPAAQGYCLTCFEEFPANDNQRLFCDAKCAQGHK